MFAMHVPRHRRHYIHIYTRHPERGFEDVDEFSFKMKCGKKRLKEDVSQNTRVHGGTHGGFGNFWERFLMQL